MLPHCRGTANLPLFTNESRDTVTILGFIKQSCNEACMLKSLGNRGWEDEQKLGWKWCTKYLLLSSRKLHESFHQAELVNKDAKHIRGALWELEHRHKLPYAHSQGESGTGVDKQGLVPWHPNGTPFELTIAKVQPEPQAQSLDPRLTSLSRL